MLTSPKRFNKIQRIAEFAANLAIIVAVVVGVSVWLRRPNTVGPLSNTSVTRSDTIKYSALGTQMAIHGVDWSTHKATLVVAISAACHYCVASAPFYSEMTHSAHVAPIVVVMPQEEQEARTFLREHDIKPGGVVSANLASIQVSATPTLLLISSSGIVTKEWVGELTNKQRNEVIESLDRS
jgi:hypothetical protein